MPKQYRKSIRIDGKKLFGPYFPTKKQANEWYQQMVEKKRMAKYGFVVTDESTLFIDYARKWFQKRQRDYPKATWASDDQRLRDYILPKIGEFPISSITSGQIKSLLTDVTDSGLSIQTRTRVKALLSTIFTSALNENPPLVKYNPVSGIKFQERRTGNKKPIYIEDAKSVLKFLKAAKEKGKLHFLVCSLAIMTGLRKSEMLALKWRHVLFDRNQLLIAQKVEQITLEVKPGTKRGENYERLIPASNVLFKILAEYRKKSKYKDENDFVLARPSDGRFYGPRQIWEFVTQVSKAADVKSHVHGLRHTFGREFADKGGNTKALQEIMGHSSSATTDRYSELSGKRLVKHGEVVSFDLDKE